MRAEARRRQAVTEERVQHLTFDLDGEEYGVPILEVREIVPFESATAVPGAPAWLRGLANLRGQPLPVLDLAVRFGGGPAPPAPQASLIVFEVDVADRPALAIGALVDGVSRVLDLAKNEIGPAPSLGGQISIRFLSGAAVSQGRPLLLLDVDRLLAADELRTLVEALAAGSSA